MEMIKWKYIYISDVMIYGWVFVWDSIDRGWPREGIKGGEAAPDGVATQNILVYWKEEGGGSLSLYLLRIILGKYGFIIDIYYYNMEVVKEGEQPPPKAEPISAVIEGEGVVCGDGGISSW